MSHWRLSDNDAEVFTSSPEQTVPNPGQPATYFSAPWLAAASAATKNTVSFATVYTGIEHVTFKARVNMHIALVRYRVTIFTFYKPGRIKVFRVTVLGAPPNVIRAFC